jgi:hypothetical protein
MNIPLNAVDLALLAVDRAIRNMGYPGFETQTLIWLSGRLEADRLRRALAELGCRHPEFASRLEAGTGATARWRPQRDEPLELAEVELHSDDDSAVLSCAAEIQSTYHDPASSSPLRFVLLHRPLGRDVLLMQYSHVLMDHDAAGIVLSALSRLLTAPAVELAPPLPATNHHLRSYLRRFRPEQRRAASQRAVELFGHALRGRAATLGCLDETRPRQVRLRIAAGSLPAEAAAALREQAARLCGVPSPSMVILAAVFRAMHELIGPGAADRNFIAGIGLDLGLRRGRPLLQNLLSIVPIVARSEELDDADALVAELTRQMRQRLKSQIDLGVVRLMVGFQRRPRHIEWVVQHLLRWTYSLWYAYFGDAGLSRLGDTEIERISYVGPTWSPMGISLLANSFAGQLHFQATYDPELVSPPLAEKLVEQVRSNLLDFAAREPAGATAGRNSYNAS